MAAGFRTPVGAGRGPESSGMPQHPRSNDATPWTRVSRCRAMPTRGRRSKPYVPAPLGSLTPRPRGPPSTFAAPVGGRPTTRRLRPVPLRFRLHLRERQFVDPARDALRRFGVAFRAQATPTAGNAGQFSRWGPPTGTRGGPRRARRNSTRRHGCEHGIDHRDMFFPQDPLLRYVPGQPTPLQRHVPAAEPATATCTRPADPAPATCAPGESATATCDPPADPASATCAPAEPATATCTRPTDPAPATCASRRTRYCDMYPASRPGSSDMCLPEDPLLAGFENVPFLGGQNVSLGDRRTSGAEIVEGVALGWRSG